MTHVLLYWNHICVLHNQEKLFLGRLKDRLLEESIELEIRYFGLGYPEHMSEYLAREDAKLPDLIVSADLEVFEDRRIFGKMEENLYPVKDWIPLRKGPALDRVWRGEILLPFVSIPLVYYSCNSSCCQSKIITEIPDLAFGGINNSAGKTLVKAVWSRYGREAAVRLLETGHAADMPIGAFNQVRTGQRETALVPSLYAMRADGITRFRQEPKEGPMLIPSFFCAAKSVPEAAARKVAEGILCRELCGFYEKNGNLLAYPECARGNEWGMEKTYFTPDRDWYGEVPPEEFYEVYDRLRVI